MNAASAGNKTPEYRTLDEDEGEKLVFHATGQQRHGGLRSNGKEPYFTYGDIVIVDSDGDHCQIVARHVDQALAERWLAAPAMLEALKLVRGARYGVIENERLTYTGDLVKEGLPPGPTVLDHRIDKAIVDAEGGKPWFKS